VVRRRTCPLTPMQSARLTEFCLAANCRDFSTRRLALQLTPAPLARPIKNVLAGKPHGLDREAYYCSELWVEACIHAGAHGCRHGPSLATYPATSSSATASTSTCTCICRR